MKILGAYIENIRSYKKSVIVFPPRGITVIYGDNGSGKTSLLMAIEFALMGLAPGSTRDIFDAYRTPRGADLLRRNTTRGLVRLLVKIGSRFYVIERTLVKSSESKYSSDTGRVEEYILCGSEFRKVNTRVFTSREEMDNYISEILGLKEKKSSRSRISTPKVYTTAIYVPQFSAHEVLSLDKEERIEIIERALGLEKYKTFRANYEKVNNELKRLIDTVNSKIEVLDKQIRERNREQLVKQRESLERELEALLREKKTLEEELSRLIEQRKELEKKLDETRSKREVVINKITEYETLEKRLKNLEEELAKNTSTHATGATIDEILTQLDREINEIALERERIGREISNKQAEIRELDSEIEKWDTKLKELYSEQGRRKAEIDNLKHQEKKLVEELEKNKEMISQGICPLCKQRIPHEHGIILLSSLQSELSEVLKKINELEEQVKEITSEIKSIEETIRELGNKREGIRRVIEELNSTREELGIKERKLIQLKTRIEELEKQRREIKEALSTIPIEGLRREHQALEEEIRGLEAEIKKLEEKEYELNEKLKDLERRIGRVESDLKTIQKQINEVDKWILELEEYKKRKTRLLKTQEYLELAGEVLGKIEDTIMKILIEDFRVYFNDYFSILAENQPLEVVVTDDFGIVTKVRIGRSSYEVSSPSGGQSMIISLAYRLALNQVVRDYSPIFKGGVLILDEPTTGFSSELVKRLRELLKKTGGREGQVIIVTHDRELIEAGDCRIKLSLDLEESETRIEYEECFTGPYEEYRRLVENILLHGKQMEHTPVEKCEVPGSKQ